MNLLDEINAFVIFKIIITYKTPVPVDDAVDIKKKKRCFFPLVIYYRMWFYFKTEKKLHAGEYKQVLMSHCTTADDVKSNSVADTLTNIFKTFVVKNRLFAFGFYLYLYVVLT